MKTLKGEFKLVDERTSKNTQKPYWIINVGKEKLCLMDGELMKGMENGLSVEATTEDGNNIVQSIKVVEAIGETTEGIDDSAKPKPEEPKKETNRNGKSIPKEYISQIKGKDFITANGLLHMAHAKGFLGWTIEEMSVDWEKDSAYCHGMAHFENDKTYHGAGSCTPKNATSMTANHFVEMAETRAKSRALRTALNIDMTTLEEISK